MTILCCSAFRVAADGSESRCPRADALAYEWDGPGVRIRLALCPDHADRVLDVLGHSDRTHPPRPLDDPAEPGL